MIRKTGRSRTLTLSGEVRLVGLSSWLGMYGSGCSGRVGILQSPACAIEYGEDVVSQFVACNGITVRVYNPDDLGKVWGARFVATALLEEFLEYTPGGDLRVFEQVRFDENGEAGTISWELTGDWSGSGSRPWMTGTPLDYVEITDERQVGSSLSYTGVFPDPINGRAAGEVMRASWTGGVQDLWPEGESSLDREVHGTSSGLPVTIANWICTGMSTSLVLINPGVPLDVDIGTLIDTRLAEPPTMLTYAGTVYRCGETSNVGGSASLVGYGGAKLRCTGMKETDPAFGTSGGSFERVQPLKWQARETTGYEPTYLGNWSPNSPQTIALDTQWCMDERQYYFRTSSRPEGDTVNLLVDQSMTVSDPTGDLAEWDCGLLLLAGEHNLGMLDPACIWTSTGTLPVSFSSAGGRKRLSVAAGVGTGEVTISIPTGSALGISLGYRYFRIRLAAGSGSIDGDPVTVTMSGYRREVRLAIDPLPAPWDPIEEIAASDSWSCTLAEAVGQNRAVRVTRDGADYIVRMDCLLGGGEIHKVTEVVIGGLVPGHVYDVESIVGIVPQNAMGAPIYPNGCGHSILQSMLFEAPDNSSGLMIRVRDLVDDELLPTAKTGTVWGKPLHWLSFHGIPFCRAPWQTITEDLYGNTAGATLTIAELAAELDRWITWDGNYGGLLMSWDYDLETDPGPDGQTPWAIRNGTAPAWWFRPRLMEEASCGASGGFTARPQFPGVIVYPGSDLRVESEKVLGAALPSWTRNTAPDPDESASGITLRARKLTEAAPGGYKYSARVVDSGLAIVAGLLPSSQANGRFPEGDPPPEGSIDEGPPRTIAVDTRYQVGGGIAEIGAYLTPPRFLQFILDEAEISQEAGIGPDLRICDWNLQYLAYQDAGRIKLKRNLTGIWEVMDVCEGANPSLEYRETDRSGPLLLAYDAGGVVYRRVSVSEGVDWTVAAYKTSAGGDVAGTHPEVFIDPLTGIEFLLVHNGTGFDLYRYSAGSSNAMEPAIPVVAAAPAGSAGMDRMRDKIGSLVLAYADGDGAIQRLTSSDNGKTWG